MLIDLSEKQIQKLFEMLEERNLLLEKKIGDKDVEIEVLKGCRTQLEGHIETLNKEKDNMALDIADKEFYQAENKKHSNEVDRLTKELEQKQKEIEARDTIIANKQKYIEELECKYDLSSQVNKELMRQSKEEDEEEKKPKFNTKRCRPRKEDK